MIRIAITAAAFDAIAATCRSAPSRSSPIPATRANGTSGWRRRSSTSSAACAAQAKLLRRHPQAHRAGLASPAPRVARRMPRRPRLNPLAAALAAAQPPPHLGHHHRFRQRVHIHVSRVPASLAPRDNGMHAVLTHVRQRHRRPNIFAASPGHALIPLTALYGPNHGDDELVAESRGT